MSTSVCHYCFSPINTGIPIVLWDGETYCSECVGALDQELLEYARTHTESNCWLLASRRRCTESGMPSSLSLGSGTVGDFPGANFWWFGWLKFSHRIKPRQPAP